MKRKRDKKVFLICGICLVLLLMITVYSWIFSPNRAETLGGPPVSQDDLKKEISEIAEAYRDLWIAAEKNEDGNVDQNTIDGIEERLVAKGYSVLDSDAVYPAYLANSDSLYTFWESMEARKNTSLSIIKVGENGGFLHYLFQNQEETGTLTYTFVSWDEMDQPTVESVESFQVYDWALTDWSSFYYQIYPENYHYIKYAQILLEPTDRELFDLNQKYIVPIGYQFTNIFLCDWQEEDFGQLSFNDVFEYLYWMENGTRVDAEQISFPEGYSYAMVPASLFENTVLPYFKITLEDFQEAAMYDEEGNYYPWYPKQTNDMIHYPMLEPQVVDMVANDDGTITLTVDVGSPDLMTNRVFSHAVTIRLLENGNFQYTGNRVTYIGKHELPPTTPRLQREQ